MLNWAAMYDGQSAVALEAALMIEARTPQRYCCNLRVKNEEEKRRVYFFLGWRGNKELSIRVLPQKCLLVLDFS